MVPGRQPSALTARQLSDRRQKDARGRRCRERLFPAGSRRGLRRDLAPLRFEPARDRRRKSCLFEREFERAASRRRWVWRPNSQPNWQRYWQVDRQPAGDNSRVREGERTRAKRRPNLERAWRDLKSGTECCASGRYDAVRKGMLLACETGKTSCVYALCAEASHQHAGTREKA